MITMEVYQDRNGHWRVRVTVRSPDWEGIPYAAVPYLIGTTKPAVQRLQALLNADELATKMTRKA